MNKKLTFATLALGIALAANAQTRVDGYKAGVTADGITYALPRTQLVVNIKTTCVTTCPGEFHDYALAYLKLQGVPTRTTQSWKIDSLWVETTGVADTSRMFTIQLRKNTSAPLVTLTPDGRLVGINKQVSQPKELEPLPQPATTTDSLPSRDYMTQEILSATSQWKMAQLTADEIYDIRENRAELSKGQADYMPKDGAQLKLMFSNLDTQERALLQLFKGHTHTTTRYYRYIISPTAEADGQVLLRFSQKLGPVEKDNLIGSPICLTLKSTHSLPAVTQLPADKAKSKKELNDIRYVMPEKMSLTLTLAGKPLLSRTVLMGQFGRIEHLGEELFNKHMDTSVTLSPVTGALVKLEAAEPAKD